ncbi:MAG: hypothetical protein FWD51_07270, partial [Betaproteobacteria bacterium]|nr:hypothetical protein [Betaproteobacteria bacterium]
GWNYIYDSSGTSDRIWLCGVDQSDVRMTLSGKYDILITFVGVDGFILIENGQKAGNKIEFIEYLAENPYKIPEVNLTPIGQDLANHYDAGFWG